MEEISALIIVDLQSDFCPGGSLGVPEGDQVVPVANEYIRRFHAAGLLIYATRDWHPAVTKHFKQYGGVWPPHCVQGTRGAEFHPDLRLPEDAIVVSKGMDPNLDSYSAFQAYEADGTELEASLRRRGIEHIFVGGLATDYCVRWTALDAMRAGLRVTALIDASLGVNLQIHDSERAIKDIVSAGATLATLNQVLLSTTKVPG
ncbi:MAG: bifunctional nicotinamidase/pyrazinamidase [Chloroflexi bacterium]|nr:bifunctional nicotinamidase/pyrazinamidase [Chloroflexota bacterium]